MEKSPRVYAVSQYLFSPYSPLVGTSLDELLDYFDSLPEVENPEEEN
ncbi:hypothetical protein [Rodentibacter trehalosifermentans]|nr:hypothetical protein [Rodentibacter trehalosifermentans]